MVEGKIRKIGRNRERDYQDAKNLERWGVKCHICGYEWETISDAWKVTCPSCSNKTDRVKTKQKNLNGGIKNE